ADRQVVAIGDRRDVVDDRRRAARRDRTRDLLHPGRPAAAQEPMQQRLARSDRPRRPGRPVVPAAEDPRAVPRRDERRRRSAPADVAGLPAASRARAVRACAPLAAVVVVHAIVYGAAVTSTPRFAPSRRNCTPATRVSSVAFAETLTVPDTVAPFDGAAIETA